MISKEEAKRYLRIPYDDDDEFIEIAIQLGYDYLETAVDDFKKKYDTYEAFARKADYWVLTFWFPTAYEEREGVTSGAPAMGYVARSLLMQLQFFTEKAGEENGA